jgi:hypothetical protein
MALEEKIKVLEKLSCKCHEKNREKIATKKESPQTIGMRKLINMHLDKQKEEKKKKPYKNDDTIRRIKKYLESEE